MALASGRSVGDVANRVDRLEGRTGGDQRAAPGERLAAGREDPEIAHDDLQDLRRLHHPARTGFATGEIAFARADDPHTVAP